MKLTKEQIEVLRSDEKGGFTEETIALLMHDKAPSKVRKSAEKVLKNHWKEEKRKALEAKALKAKAVTQGEISKIIADFNKIIRQMSLQIVSMSEVLTRKGVMTNEELARRMQTIESDNAEVDLCKSCASYPLPPGVYCHKHKLHKKKVVFFRDKYSALQGPTGEQVLECSLYKKAEG